MPKRLRTQRVPNVLLASLPRSDYEQVQKVSDLVALGLRQVLNEAGEETVYAYFPISGVVSMLTTLQDGSDVEIATVGNEGMVDVAAFVGLPSSGRWLVQVPGQALRIEASALRLHASESVPLTNTMHNYMLALFIQISQTAACNRRHPVEQRCARWLLMTHDRVEADDFPMTHEFLADMLGIRRPSVSIAMSMLNRAGYISYRRGKVNIHDREGLEQAACECYRVVREQFDSRFPVSAYLAEEKA